MTSPRLFLGLPLESEARQGVAAYVRALQARTPMPGRQHSPDNWHLTLVFLGHVTAERRESLIQAVDQAALGGAFTLTLSGLAAFPAAEAAKVLTLGVGEGLKPLAALQRQVEAAAVASGHVPDPRPFTPHVTLARLSRGEDVRGLIQSGGEAGIFCPVSRVVLFESRSGSPGPDYVPQRSWPLSVTIG